MSPSTEADCSNCRRVKQTDPCGLCGDPVCKDCRLTLEGDDFAYLVTRPAELSHLVYCPRDFDATVEPAKTRYEEIAARAREVLVFFVTQKARLPLVRKAKDPVKVTECDDRDLTILKLAYQSAEQGFNALIETEVISKKVRNHGYQTSHWSGVARPAEVDEAKLGRYAD